MDQSIYISFLPHSSENTTGDQAEEGSRGEESGNGPTCQEAYFWLP